ncbi:hypothetical protein [Streptomyces sp. NPDC020817]|uniref:hypothetical protein n=1 Tax=Streptomyces sp. NPDC020817 TaxID=3365095 RepID=UPI0037B9EEE9
MSAGEPDGGRDSVETDEPAQRVPPRATLYEDVIRSQQPHVEHRGESRHVRVIAPVTNRGDAIGLLELFLPSVPDADVMREIGERAPTRRGGHQADRAMRGHGRSGFVGGQLLRISLLDGRTASTPAHTW